MSDAARYEQVPYPGLAFPQTHPDRLALLAVLHGLDPAPPDAARVLEVGCGDGMNLVAMAAHAPGLSAAGFDLVDPALGRAAAAELGLANVRLEQGDLLDGADRGTFDYVVAHGVYAWVPDPVREALMALIARSLAPHGVAFVSYNALPGARLRTMLREMVLLHAGDADDPAARGPSAGASCTPSSPRGRRTARTRTAQVLQSELGRLRRLSTAVLAHDDLGPRYEPVWLRDVAAHAGRHGLRYLADAEPSELWDDRRPPGVDAQLDALAGGDASRGSSTPTCSPAARSARRCSAARPRPSTTPSTRRGCAGCGSPPWTASSPRATPRSPGSSARGPARWPTPTCAHAGPRPGGRLWRAFRAGQLELSPAAPRHVAARASGPRRARSPAGRRRAGRS